MLILKRSSANGYKENLADAHTVCELADNLRDAIMDYQVSCIPLITLRMRR